MSCIVFFLEEDYLGIFFVNVLFLEKDCGFIIYFWYLCYVMFMVVNIIYKMIV